MVLKDILAVVMSQAANEHVIAFSEQLARQNDGRISVSLVNWQPNVAPVDGWVLDAGYAEMYSEASRHLDEERIKLEGRLQKCERAGPIDAGLVEMGAAGYAIGLRGLHADVSVVAMPTKANTPSAQTILEAALFESGRPVIAVPPEWKGGSIGKHVLVAWKPRREAARALADAASFITGADRVSVVTVDASPSRDYGDAPGADIVSHLAFRGAKTTLYNLDSAGQSETAAILKQAVALGADLIVMGGYGRARMSEFIFGGVTREILRTATLPVLLSH